MSRCSTVKHTYSVSTEAPWRFKSKFDEEGTKGPQWRRPLVAASSVEELHTLFLKINRSLPKSTVLLMLAGKLQSVW